MEYNIPAGFCQLRSFACKCQRQKALTFLLVFQPPPANQTVLPQSGSLPSPSVSDGGLFISMTDAKRQVPTFMCSLLDK